MTTKNLKISEELHTKIKTYCSKNKLSLNEWVDKLLTLNLKYPVLINLLIEDNDIEYFENKLKRKQNEYTSFDEYEKTKKQLQLLKDGKQTFIDTHLHQWK